MISLDSCNISWDPFLENYDIQIWPGTTTVLDTVDPEDKARSVSHCIQDHTIPQSSSSCGTMLLRFTFFSPLKDENSSANVMSALVYMSLLAWFFAYALHLGLCDASQNLQVRFFWHLLHVNLVLILWKYIPFLLSCSPYKTTNVDDVDSKREECQLTSLMTKHINALCCSTFRLRMFRVFVSVFICIWGFNLLELPAKVVVWI